MIYSPEEIRDRIRRLSAETSADCAHLRTGPAEVCPGVQENASLRVRVAVRPQDEEAVASMKNLFFLYKNSIHSPRPSHVEETTTPMPDYRQMNMSGMCVLNASSSAFPFSFSSSICCTVHNSHRSHRIHTNIFSYTSPDAPTAPSSLDSGPSSASSASPHPRYT